MSIVKSSGLTGGSMSRGDQVTRTVLASVRRSGCGGEGEEGGKVRST